MDESIHIKVESPAAPVASGVSGADNGIFGIRIPRERVVPTSTWDKDNYEPSLVYPQGPIFGDYDPTTSPDYRDKSSWVYIPSDTMIDENPFADTEGEFNGGIKTALVWDGIYHRVCHALEVGGPFTFEYTARRREIRPPMEIVAKPETGRQSDDDDFIISMSDIPPHREGQKNDPYAARFEESQDRRGAIGAPASEGKEGVIQPEMRGDNPPGLEEGDPPVPVKVEDTPLGEDHSTPVKTESQDIPILDFPNVRHSLPRAAGGIVGDTSQTAPLKIQFSETPMFDVSKIPHHVGDEQVVYPPAAIEPQPEPRPEPSQYPRSSKKSVNQEEMTDKNINQMDGMDICSQELVNGSAATTTLPENAPLGLSMNVKRKFGGAKASSSNTAAGPFTNRIDGLHVQQDSNAGNGKEPAAVNNQEGAFNSAKTIQYHDPQPKTTGPPIPQPKPKPKASHASGESILARAPTNTRPPPPPPPVRSRIP
ncbi:hypothetical protein DFP73DRAFT_334146 [Morchella snyderi]|nr:hypothetical protein DFP73DRAFT_334146 [Morchella snyderi]